MKSIVLASGSAYRAALLQKLHIDFVCYPSDIDENIYLDHSAEQRALYLSQAKALAIAKRFSNHLIIGSDQVAMCDGQILNKPGNRENAIQQLTQQSGKSVTFYTGLSVLDTTTNKSLSTVERCTVHFKTLSDTQIQHYVDLEQPFDCAGSFKSEALGIALFSRIEANDPNTLIGLPLIKLIEFLDVFGLPVL